MEGWKQIRFVSDTSAYTAPPNSRVVLLRGERVQDEESLRTALAEGMELSSSMEPGWDSILHQLEEMTQRGHESSMVLVHDFHRDVLNPSALRHYLTVLWRLSHRHHGMGMFHWEFVFRSNWRPLISDALDHLG